MLFTNMRVHNIMIVFAVDLLILKIIQLFRNSTTSFSVFVWMNANVFRQEDLSAQRWRVKFI